MGRDGCHADRSGILFSSIGANHIMAIATINPATGETIKNFDALTDAQVDQKIQRAAEAFPAFRKLSFADRARMMMRAAEILESEKDSLAHLMTLEMGKTLRSAVDEAVKCAWVCRYYAENAERFLAEELSILAGIPFHRSGADGGQCGLAETRIECPPMRNENRRALAEGGRP